MMFKKKYDKDIEDLIEHQNILAERINSLNDIIIKLQKPLLKMTKTQAHHRQLIQFFINHAKIDPDAQEDLIKMLKSIADINKIIDEDDKNERNN